MIGVLLVTACLCAAPTMDVAQETDLAQEAAAPLLTGLHVVRAAYLADDGKALYDRWQAFYVGQPKDPAGKTALLKWVRKHENVLSRFEKFVVMCHVAGFGQPSFIGPNSLKDQDLGLYIAIQKSLRIPQGEVRSLALDDKLKELRVTIPRREKDKGLFFQEILWEIIVKYELDFDIKDGVFVITGKK